MSDENKNKKPEIPHPNMDVEREIEKAIRDREAFNWKGGANWERTYKPDEVVDTTTPPPGIKKDKE